jgi:flagella basal body P-ring formation protein FlgA
MRFLVPILVVAMTAVVVAEAPLVAVQTQVADAVKREVQRRMGLTASVIVTDIDVSVRDAAGASLAVVVAPQSRLGTPIEFVVIGEGSSGRAMQVGRGRADVHVAVAHAQLSRTIARGETLTPADLAEVVGVPKGVGLQRLPTVRELTGATLRRDLIAGSIVTIQDVAMPPTIRAGEAVQAIALVGGVRVAAEVTSLENGASGAIVRVVNRETRRELRARVIAKGIVEVIHE